MKSACVVDNIKKKSEDMTDPCKQVSLEITKMDLLYKYGIYAQDCSELKVAECLNFDEIEGCDARSGDKIGRLDIG